MPRSDRGERNSPSTAKQDGSRSKRECNNGGTENPQAVVNPLFGSTTVRLVALVSCVFYVACAKLKSHPVVLDFFRSLSRPASGVDYSFSAHIEWIGKVEDMQSRNEFGRIFEVPEGERDPCWLSFYLVAQSLLLRCVFSYHRFSTFFVSSFLLPLRYRV
jgi:hypothetical protein